MRGISFKIPNKYTNLFDNILKNIDVTKYFWYNDEHSNQIFIEKPKKDKCFYFEKKFYSGKEFKNKIKTKENYFVFLAKLQAQLTDVFQEINTYKDFLESNCELLVLIVDSVYAEIYVKNNETIKKIEENAKNNNYTEINYITEENDGRTKLSVL